MGSLTEQQVEGFYKYGFLKVDGVLDPEEYLDPIIEEYSGVLDRLADELYEKGEITSKYEDLEFGDRVTAIYAESGKQYSGYFDFSLPFMGVTEETPFWTGQAVLNALTAEPLLDAVESLIGPEIYSNPVQHVRIKPPEQYLPKNANGEPVIGATEWHQDHGVVTEDADETEMITAWFSLTDAAIEQGPLKVVPQSHDSGLLTHCLNYQGTGRRVIPENLFDIDKTLPLPTKRGDVIFLHRETVHGSLSNVSERIRWSFDLRYNPIGQPTGRGAFPGFVARSRNNPEQELRDADTWTEMWTNCRSKMARINQGDMNDIKFGRWNEGHPDCA